MFIHTLRIIKNNYIKDLIFNKNQSLYFKIYKHLPRKIKIILNKVGILIFKKKILYFEIAKNYDALSNIKLFDYYNLFQNFVEKDFNFYNSSEFLIGKNQFIGSLGCYFHIYSILEAKNIGIIKKNLSLYLNHDDELNIPNKYLFNYFKKYINIHYQNHEYENFSSVGYYVPINKKAIPLRLAHNYIIDQSIKTNKKKLITLNEKDNRKGIELLKSYNIQHKFIITLHVRESGFHNDDEYFRNGNIDDYIPAIKYIIKRGGVVFRMGDSSMKPLPKIKGLIDYSQWEKKDKFLELYLASVSKFCIGSSSGYTMIPYIFNKPILISNTGTMDDYFILRPNDFFLPKILRKKNNNKNIKLKELFEFPISSWWHNYEKKLKKKDLELIDNDSIDILKTVISMYYLFIKKKDLCNKNIRKKYVSQIEETNLSAITSIKLKAHAKINSSFILKNKLL